MHTKKIVIVVMLVAAVAAFFAFDLDRYLSLQALKDSQGALKAWYVHNPAQAIAGFLVGYIMVTALALPGASIMTLAAGAIFGFWVGLVVVSFASTIGATLSMLSARYVLRDSVKSRFGRTLADIDRGVAKEGGFYLFTLRLVPLVPFFVINLAMGLTAMPVRTFYWVSQVGMLAGTAVFVNAGTQLARLETLAGILSPALIGSFALLGVFPIFAKMLLKTLRARRVYKPWASQKPARFDRNVLVIGAGAGGLVTAYIAAAVKAKVTLVEAHLMGGDCLNFGCVPSKALIKSASVAHAMRHADRYGLQPVQPRFSFKAVMQRVQQVVADIAPHDSVERYTGLGVEVVQGYATLVNPWTVRIRRHDGAEQILTSRAIVLATGARPFVPPLPGLDDVGYVTSDTVWERFAQLDEIPKRLLVLGGGPIGCELAQAFARLGSHVVQVEMADRLMVREDGEVSSFVAERLRADGVDLRLSHKALRCESVNGAKVLVAEHAGAHVHLEFDELLCAVGRQARLEGYGLQELGIPASRTIETNEFLQTVYPNIYACGDVAGPYQFTHTAAHQAWYAAVNALFDPFKKFKADYRVIPWVTFVDPEVARVGFNEADAKAQGVAYEVTRYGIDDLDRAIADSAAHGWVKVLTEPGRDRVLGVTIVGAHAGDLLAEYVLAMKHGLGLNKILGTIHSYPTMSEANKYAAGEWKRAHQPHGLLRWVARFHEWRRG
jgi:pyruvate/2-oxoglutarate dehydrogenase complex dihydrolipoamide dehydrogenase (E3) component/uncharacterized membrane protein YdjX (TVP38/TMEM64 family)